MIGRKNDPAYGKGRKGEGALRWCNNCSRIHRSQLSCNLVATQRVAKSGKKVMRLVHIGRLDADNV